MTVRAMQVADLDAVVAVHQHAFPGFFLTRMGPRFLRVYYRFCIGFEGSINLVWLDKTGRIQGFVVGFPNPKRFYTALASRRRAAFWPVIVAVLRRPGLLPRLIHNLRRAAMPPPPEGEVELSAIGVRQQGAGIGTGLIAAFLASAGQCGYRSVYLSTDAADNASVNRFYTSAGFKLVRTSDSGGRAMNIYRIELGSDSPPGN